MKFLVTGGCGFVGAAVCRRFADAYADAEIIALDSLRRRGSETNVAELEGRGVRVIHGDIRQPADVDSLGPVDWVIDAAAEPSVLAGTAAGGHTGRRQLVDHNLLGTVNLLEAAARWQAGVVLLSTSRVYSIPALASLPLIEQGGRLGAPAFALDTTRSLPTGLSPAGISEAFSTAAPVSLYGATKLACETLALEYAHAVGTPLVVDRCGVLAGAGADLEHRAVPGKDPSQHRQQRPGVAAGGRSVLGADGGRAVEGRRHRLGGELGGRNGRC